METQNTTLNKNVRRNKVLAIYLACISTVMISFSVVTMLQHL